MGWNSLTIHRPGDPLMAGVRPGDYVYYVHSFTLRAAMPRWWPPHSMARGWRAWCVMAASAARSSPRKKRRGGAFHPGGVCKGGGVMRIYPAIDLREGRVVPAAGL